MHIIGVERMAGGSFYVLCVQYLLEMVQAGVCVGGSSNTTTFCHQPSILYNMYMQ